MSLLKKNDLELYQKRKQLIEAYQAELDSGLETVDTVRGSMCEHPYLEHVITIRGQDIVRKQWLRQRVYALSAQCTRAEAFVANVEDEHMRALLYWHYLQGLSWPKVKKTLRMRSITPDCLRKRVDNFLQRNC